MFRIRRSLSRFVKFYTTSNRRSHQVDICIVGAGPCGSILANLLLKSTDKVSIAVIDKGGFEVSELNDTKNDRVFAISRSSTSILKEIGIWESITEKMYAHPFTKMKVWDDRIKNTFCISGSLNKPLGYMIGSKVLNNSSIEKLLNTSSNQLHLIKSSINNIDFPIKDYPVIHLSDGGNINARLIIGADGFNSTVRREAGIGIEVYEYNEKAIVGTVLIEESNHNLTAWQRFLSTGPIALLPITRDGYSSFVWTLPSSIADEVSKLDLDDLKIIINSAFKNEEVDYKFLINNITLNRINIKEEAEWGRDRYLKFGDKGYSDSMVICPSILEVIPNTIKTFPLKLANSNSYIENRAVLIGDAAHLVHPLAGFGLNMGLEDIECLNKELKKLINNGMDFGSKIHLRDYAKERYVNATMKLGIVHVIKSIFDNETFLGSSIRSFVISCVDTLPLLKVGFI